ncbi:hypothetical protein J6590_042477 [Homalodisca vitripennis]|nr:hypothetical protein J6590_042477 [Homalodisca vitripennis]
MCLSFSNVKPINRSLSIKAEEKLYINKETYLSQQKRYETHNTPQAATYSGRHNRMALVRDLQSTVLWQHFLLSFFLLSRVASVELDNSQVQNNVIAGQVLMPPENCPEILYNMMKRCWNYQPKMRPTFLELVEWILGLPNFTPNQNFPMVSYYHNRY